MIAYNLSYYWFHRVSHEVNLFWAAHVVHHQSEDYSLGTDLRQSGYGRFDDLYVLHKTPGFCIMGCVMSIYFIPI